MEPLKRFGVNIGRDGCQQGAVYGLACDYAVIEKRITDSLRPFKLTPAKFNALMVIKHQGKDKGLSQIDIGKQLIVTASNMTRLLDKMSKEGLIDRFSRKGDRRVNIIKITSKGSELLDKVWPGYYQQILRITKVLSNKELDILAKLLIKWFAGLENSFKK